MPLSRFRSLCGAPHNERDLIKERVKSGLAHVGRRLRATDTSSPRAARYGPCSAARKAIGRLRSTPRRCSSGTGIACRID
jgi:hypothetical protein